MVLELEFNNEFQNIREKEGKLLKEYKKQAKKSVKI
jgi:hypothetical protein